jgi:hypothetical protein
MRNFLLHEENDIRIWLIVIVALEDFDFVNEVGAAELALVLEEEVACT